MADTAIQDVPRPRHAVDVPPRAVRLPEFVGLERDVLQLHRILDELELTVVGAGSVGKVICGHVAQLHPRSLTIVDPGVYERENLLNQCITPDAIGSNKAEYVGRWCAQISPNTRVRVYAGRAEELPLAALCSSGIVMLATDNLGVEVDVAQRCLHAGVPLVQASVAGEFLVAQIRFCGNADGTGPCLACGFAPVEWQHVNQTIFSCQGGDLDNARPQPANLAATRSTSSLCSLAADLAMMQVLRHLGGLGAPVADTLLDYCGYTHRATISPLKRNNQCPLEHVRWQRCKMRRGLANYTPRELANIALGHVRSADGISLTIERSQFCEAGVCTRCGAQQSVERFIARLRGAGKCAACGAAMDGLPFYTHRPTPLAVLGKWADQPLQDVVDRSPESIVVRGTNAAVLCEYSSPNDSNI